MVSERFKHFCLLLKRVRSYKYLGASSLDCVLASGEPIVFWVSGR